MLVLFSTSFIIFIFNTYKFLLTNMNITWLCIQPAFLSYCFQTYKDHSAPKLTPKILFTPPSAGPPSVRLLIAEKAGGLLVKPWASRLSRGPPRDTTWEGLACPVWPSEIHFMFVHTLKENLLTTISSLPNPTAKKETAKHTAGDVTLHTLEDGQWCQFFKWQPW